MSELIFQPWTPSAPSDAAVRYVDYLAQTALMHRAVCHPYLAALSECTLPDLRWALADFARHHAGYSAYFPRFLEAVIARLEDIEHRAALFENLTEESGIYGAAELAQLDALGIKRDWIVGVAHPLLFRRFAAAVGADLDLRTAPEVSDWRTRLLALLTNGSAAEAVGALGLGTENIVRTIYGPFVRALARLELPPADTVFFPLHTVIDDHHQATLQRIAADCAGSAPGRAGLRQGMHAALDLRAVFWDWLYRRALDPGAAERSDQEIR